MKPSVPKGTRDFSPTEMVRRNFIFDTIRNVYQRYGYLPIETPAMENLETLMGKYGEEGDKLIFKILNSGDFLNNISDEILRTPNSRLLTNYITEKALRYDLTVPFARYVVQHQNEITFPFKRYQIQPVWRADKPQKGRYREFYQCDADVIGSNSLLNEVEIVQIIDDVFRKLGISIKIHFNNRKVLAGIFELSGAKQENFYDVTSALDKIEKVGVEVAMQELLNKGIDKTVVEKLQNMVVKLLSKSFGKEMVSELKKELTNTAIGLQGIDEVDIVMKTLGSIYSKDDEPLMTFDISLARGLNYYTGAIFEVKANNVQIGSICGGGRYDDLTGIFGLPNVSGVGISFGIDRIYDVMNELNLFQQLSLPETTTKVMFAHFGEQERDFCISLASKLRVQNINTEIYPDLVKIKKQFDYANKKQIPFVVVVGSEEIQTGKLSLKDMVSGHQEKLSIDEIIEKLK